MYSLLNDLNKSLDILIFLDKKSKPKNFIYINKYIVFTQILYLLNAKRKTEGTEKGKHEAYNIDHRFWPKSF